ncbi:hypothetical protein EQ486_02735 [Staphylococcus pseudintermedius]|nr:hypothetical protein [Staphylococcus pseudintermedius]
MKKTFKKTLTNIHWVGMIVSVEYETDQVEASRFSPVATQQAVGRLTIKHVVYVHVDVRSGG